MDRVRRAPRIQHGPLKAVQAPPVARSARRVGAVHRSQSQRATAAQAAPAAEYPPVRLITSPPHRGRVFCCPSFFDSELLADYSKVFVVPLVGLKTLSQESNMTEQPWYADEPRLSAAHVAAHTKLPRRVTPTFIQ